MEFELYGVFLLSWGSANKPACNEVQGEDTSCRKTREHLAKKHASRTGNQS